jgi:hypothetical protein
VAAVAGPVALSTSAASIERLLADRAKAIEALADADAMGSKLPPREADAIGQAAYNRVCDLEDAIMATPTRSLADLAVKARIVASRDDARGWDDDHVRRLAADVQAFAGIGAWPLRMYRRACHDVTNTDDGAGVPRNDPSARRLPSWPDKCPP